VAGLAVLTGALTGCTASSLDTGPQNPAPTGSPPAGRAPGPTRDSDVGLAARVLDGEQAMLDRVLATLRRHPGLATALAGARQAHRAHVALLIGAVPPGARRDDAAPAPRPVPARSAAALRVLARAEQRLAQLRTADALDARSGPFARVLASMAAAAAQQGTVLAGAAVDQR
jgi:hypothetical protein